MVRHAAAALGMLVVLVLPASIARSASAAFFCPVFQTPGINVWTGAVSSSWFAPGNWSAGHVPTATEQACVQSATNTPIQIATGTTAEIAQLKTLQSITLSAGTLRLDGPNTSLVQSGTLTVSGGTLTGAGNLDVNGGTFHWSYDGSGVSTVSGTGTLEIGSGGTLTVDGGGTHELDRLSTIDSGATATVGDIKLGASVGLDIGGTLTLTGSIGSSDTSALVDVFAGGTLTGSGFVQAPLTNHGLVQASGNTFLALSSAAAGSPSDGVWAAPAGTGIDFDGSEPQPFVLSGGSFTGTGTIEASSPAQRDQLELSVPFVVPTGMTFRLEALSGVGGAGPLTVDGSLVLRGGQLGVPTTIASGGTVAILGGGAALAAPLDLSSGAAGTWTTDATVHGDSIHIHAGATLEKSGGTGLSEILAPLQNDGAVAVDAGTLRLEGDSSESGSWTVGSGAALAFGVNGIGTYTLTGGSFAGSGTVRADANIDLEAPFTLPSSLTFELAGGTLSGTGALTVNGAFRWSGESTLTGATTTTVGGTLTLDDSHNGGNRNLRGGHTLTLAAGGTGAWSGADDVQLGEGAKLNLGGPLAISNDRVIGNLGGASSLIHVLAAGGLTKSAGTGTTSSLIPLTNDGTLTVGSGTLALAGGLTNYDGSTHSLTGGAFVIGSGTTLQFAGADVRTNAAQLTLGGGGAHLSDGSLDGLRNLTTNALGATLTLGPGSFLSTPGAFANKGTLAIGVAGPAPGTAGELQSAGTTTLGGTLALSTAGGFVPPVGQTYTILAYPAKSGKLKTITGQAIPGSDLAYDVATGATSITLTAKKSADVSVTGSAPATAPAGSAITYTETVHDGGPADATGVKLTDTLPNGSTFVSVTTAAGTCTHTSTSVTCTIGAMTFGGADVVVTIQIMAPNAPGTTLTNRTKVKAKELDLASTNNTATQKTMLS